MLRWPLLLRGVFRRIPIGAGSICSSEVPWADTAREEGTGTAPLVSRMSHPFAQFGLEPTGPAATLHTTSDLLVLLAAEGRPFGEVAAAVAARFGGGDESQAWLAKTLITLLRDGLLFNAVEKLNAAYLLRFAAPGVPGAREALIHLSLPDSGEPPAVRAWAAGLASAAAAAQAQQQSAGVEQLHYCSPQQVLAGAVMPLGSQPQLYHPQQLRWQGAPAAVQQPAQTLESNLPSSSQAAQPALPLQEQQKQQAEQQQQQNSQQEHLQLMDRQNQLRSLAALLQQAAQGPLVPALQLRLTQALASPVAAALTEPLAAAVDGSSRGRSSSGGREGSLEPHDMRGLVEHNSPVAAEVGGDCACLYICSVFQPSSAAASAGGACCARHSACHWGMAHTTHPNHPALTAAAAGGAYGRASRGGRSVCSSRGGVAHVGAERGVPVSRGGCRWLYPAAAAIAAADMLGSPGARFPSTCQS